MSECERCRELEELLIALAVRLWRAADVLSRAAERRADVVNEVEEMKRGN